MLPGIPISEDQCMGDSLPIINAALSSLDYDVTRNVADMKALLQMMDGVAMKTDLVSLTSEPVPPLINTNSSTVNLYYSNITGRLSAETVVAPAPVSRVFDMYYSYSGTALPWGQPYESTNPAYPGPTTFTNNNSRYKSITNTVFSITQPSVISITDVAYWNYDQASNGGAPLTDTIQMWQGWDFSVDGGSTWLQMEGTEWADNYKVRIISGVSYWGAQIPNAGNCASGTVMLTSASGVDLKFKPKFRFQKFATQTALNVTALRGNGSHTITIDPNIN